MIVFTNVTLTPDQARSMLAKNVKNRTPKKKFIRKLVASIKAGRWEETHQCIAVGPDGNIIDGQHRLYAIAESGVSCNVWIAMYTDESHAQRARLVTDTGNKRELGEQLELVGTVGDRGRERVAVARMICSLETSNNDFSQDEEVAAVVEYTDDYNAIRSKFSSKMNSAVLAAFAWARDVSPEAVDHLAEKVASQVNLTATEVVLARASFEPLAGGWSERLNHMIKILRGIEACLNGEKIARLIRAIAPSESQVVNRLRLRMQRAA